MMLMLNLGNTTSGNPISVAKMDNPHVFVTGRSGSGKSYFLKRLLAQASSQGALCLVLDYTGDYRSYEPPDNVSFQKISVSSTDFTLNPLRGPEGQPQELLAQQFLNLIHSAFRLGNRASMALRQAVLAYLRDEQGTPTLHGLIECTKARKAGGSGKGLESALELLELTDSLLTCGTEPSSLNLSTPGITVLDFGALVDVQLRNLLLSMILSAIWTQRTTARSMTPPIILLLDEAQTLPWGNGSIMKRILCEGRKYGLAGWFASQWISDKEAVAALEQAYLRVHFRPDEENARLLAKRLSQESSHTFAQCAQLVGSLQVGQYLVRYPSGKWIKGSNFNKN